MEQVRNEQIIYSAAVYCRPSKDDEQAGESISIETQKMMLTDFCHERGFSIYEIYADDEDKGTVLLSPRKQTKRDKGMDCPSPPTQTK